MTDTYIAMFPLIAEMIYLKTFAISVLISFNKHWFEYIEPTVLTRPLKYDLISLEMARKVHKESPAGEAMHWFICCFNSFNHYSMVAYPVGMHCNHFRHGKESLENIFFVLYQSKHW
jgi:hypothetical protein